MQIPIVGTQYLPSWTVGFGKHGPWPAPNGWKGKRMHSLAICRGLVSSKMCAHLPASNVNEVFSWFFRHFVRTLYAVALGAFIFSICQKCCFRCTQRAIVVSSTLAGSMTVVMAIAIAFASPHPSLYKTVEPPVLPSTLATRKCILWPSQPFVSPLSCADRASFTVRVFTVTVQREWH